MDSVKCVTKRESRSAAHRYQQDLQALTLSSSKFSYGAPGQCPGTGHQTGGEPSAHTGRTGVFALGARELRASLATAGVDRPLSGHARAGATRIAASPAHRPNRHREVVKTDLGRGPLRRGSRGVEKSSLSALATPLSLAATSA
jgi:hypothetical protein